MESRETVAVPQALRLGRFGHARNRRELVTGKLTKNL
jgi:hypothetical protein